MPNKIHFMIKVCLNKKSKLVIATFPPFWDLNIFLKQFFGSVVHPLQIQVWSRTRNNNIFFIWPKHKWCFSLHWKQHLLVRTVPWFDPCDAQPVCWSIFSHLSFYHALTVIKSKMGNSSWTNYSCPNLPLPKRSFSKRWTWD